MDPTIPPTGYERDMGPYRLQIRDGYCEEPIGWGFKLINRIGEERFNKIRPKMEYASGHWFYISKQLTREEAIKKYGPITNEEWGPQGGWRSVTFGKTKFISDMLR